MSPSMLMRPAAAYAAMLAGFKRLHSLWFTLLQTSVAAGLAWYIANDVLEHRQPFFAPTSAAVCLSASNVLRAQRAVQMIIGVSLGIWIGVAVVRVLGLGAVPIAVTALISLCVAVFIGRGLIGRGLMFVNQTVVSSILVLALYRNGVAFERLDDALIGGGVAIVFAIVLFPANPLVVLRNASVAVLHALQGVLTHAADVACGDGAPQPDWPMRAIDRVHEQVGGLIQARTTARQVVRVAPRRWGLRAAVLVAEHQAVHVALLAGSVVQLARVVGAALDGRDRLPEPVHDVLVELAAATNLADSDSAAVIERVATARQQASALQSAARERTEVLLAEGIKACVDELQRVIDLDQR